MKRTTLATAILISFGASAQEGEPPILLDRQVLVDSCVYEIGQRNPDQAVWACVTFNPLSVGSNTDFDTMAGACQDIKPEGNHALWGNYIVLWPVTCYCRWTFEVEADDPRCIECEWQEDTWAEHPDCQPPPMEAHLTWTLPTQNVDGTPLIDLAGTKIYYSQESGNWNNVKVLADPTQTSYTVENLSPGTWYFTATAWDFSGNESFFSNIVSKTFP